MDTRTMKIMTNNVLSTVANFGIHNTTRLAKSSRYSGRNETIFKLLESKYWYNNYKIINVLFGTSQEVLTKATRKQTKGKILRERLTVISEVDTWENRDLSDKYSQYTKILHFTPGHAQLYTYDILRLIYKSENKELQTNANDVTFKTHFKFGHMHISARENTYWG